MKQGETILVSTIMNLAIALIVGFSVFYIISNFFSSDQGVITAYDQLVVAVDHGHLNYDLGDQRPVQIKLGRNNYIVLFGPGIDKVYQESYFQQEVARYDPETSTREIDPGGFVYTSGKKEVVTDTSQGTRFFTQRPKEVCEHASCLCLCLSAKQLRPRESYSGSSGVITQDSYQEIGCSENELRCHTFSYGVLGSCTGSEDNFRSGCVGGLLVDRGMSYLGNYITRIDTIYLEKSSPDQMILHKFPGSANTNVHVVG